MPRYSGQAHQVFIAAVQNCSFSFALPPISRSFNTPYDHFDADECIGDSLLGSAILVVLRRMYPKITAPGIYSDIKSAVASNSSLFHLMRKAGQVSDDYPSRYQESCKHISDQFEARMWVFFDEKGFEALCTWVSATLGTIITVCLESILEKIDADAAYFAHFADTRKHPRSDIESSSDGPAAKRAKTSHELKSSLGPGRGRPSFAPARSRSTEDVDKHTMNDEKSRRPIAKLPQERKQQPGLVPSPASAGASSEPVPGPAYFPRVSSSAKENPSQSRNDSGLGLEERAHSDRPASTHDLRFPTPIPSSLPLHPASMPLHSTPKQPSSTSSQDRDLKPLALVPSSVTNFASRSWSECSKPELPRSSIAAATRGPLSLVQMPILDLTTQPHLPSSRGHALSLAPATGASSRYAPWGYLQDPGQNSRPISAPPA